VRERERERERESRGRERERNREREREIKNWIYLKVLYFVAFGRMTFKQEDIRDRIHTLHFLRK
jgi:hypothetical protein